MKYAIQATLLMLLLSLPFTATLADEYEDTKQMFEKAGASNMFETAHGYALFPTIGKGGFVVGGAYGKGRVYQGGLHVGNTSMTQASIGFQVGGTGYSQVIFFEDKRALDEFTGGNFEFGAEAQATAITAAAGATANTAGNRTSAGSGKNNTTVTGGGFNKGMATYTITKGGLMAEASIAGQKFSYTDK
ncbi:MAG: lipid-binding SYLF domain-containing protein [Gammaproteobacteria bacterium]|nr:lipid-binding SYLF domain-containing protein [Gammaproteobacteria bacterium]